MKTIAQCFLNADTAYWTIESRKDDKAVHLEVDGKGDNGFSVKLPSLSPMDARALAAELLEQADDLDAVVK